MNLNNEMKQKIIATIDFCYCSCFGWRNKELDIFFEVWFPSKDLQVHVSGKENNFVITEVQEYDNRDETILIAVFGYIGQLGRWLNDIWVFQTYYG